MPLVTGVVVLVFGGLTLVAEGRDLHQDEADHHQRAVRRGCCSAGSPSDKPLLAIVFDAVFELTEEGWRKLTLRWAMFFLVLAVLNEIVWRTHSTDFWVELQGLRHHAADLRLRPAQMPLLLRYETKTPAG